MSTVLKDKFETRVQKQAGKFLAKLIGDGPAAPVLQGGKPREERHRQMWELVKGAFTLYGLAWEGLPKEGWQYPEAELKENRLAPFRAKDNEPWCILLRRAVELRDAEVDGPDLNLDKLRRDAAEHEWTEANFEDVEDTGGWDVDGNVWSRRVFWTQENGEESRVGSFGVRFKPGTVEVEDTWNQ